MMQQLSQHMHSRESWTLNSNLYFTRNGIASKNNRTNKMSKTVRLNCECSNLDEFITEYRIELGRCRYFRSVSLFGIFLGIFKVGIGIGIGIFSGPLLYPVSAARSLSSPGFQTVSNARSARLFVYGFL